MLSVVSIELNRLLQINKIFCHKVNFLGENRWAALFCHKVNFLGENRWAAQLPYTTGCNFVHYLINVDFTRLTITICVTFCTVVC